MDKLSRRSDSAVETPSGLLGVIPWAKSGVSGETSWFEFKANMLSEVTRIEWPNGAPVIVLDQDIAKSLVRLGYAGPVDDKTLDEYNAAVDKFNAAQGATPPDATVTTLPQTQPVNNVQSNGPAPETPSLTPITPSVAPLPVTPAALLQPGVIPDIVQLQAPAVSPPPAQSVAPAPAAIDLLNGPPPTPKVD